MTEITFIRHGETYANTNKIYSNITDYPLDNTGLKNVEITAQKLKNEVFEVFLYGKRKRVQQTAQAVLNALSTKPKTIIETDEIDELHFGDFEGLNADEAQAQYPVEWGNYMTNWQTFVFPNGSDIEQFHINNAIFIKSVLNKYKNKKIALVGHYGCISAFVAAIKNNGAEDFLNFRLANAQYIKFTI